MPKFLVVSGLLAVALLLFGCSSEIPTQPDKPQASRLGDSIEISLADLLTRPRSELAAMADEWSAKIHFQEKSRRAGTLNLSLLSELRLPLVVPVWREAKYSARVGFSLPPYLAEDARDSQLALHVARYGDLEAARKLVEPGDRAALGQIEGCALEQNYPLEWTRLAGLLLHVGQMRLAAGDVDGGTEIVVLHRQLRTILGPRAAKSPLGAALLARGRETLDRAAQAWQADKKTELAEQARGVLAAWGDVAPPPLALHQGAERAELKRALATTAEGPCLPAPSVLRGLDVLELPFPEEGAEAVLACVDDAGKLEDVFITYQAGINEYFPEPVNFAHLFEESNMTGQESPKAAGLRGRNYRIDGWTCDVALVNHGAGLGALVRFASGKQTPPAKSLSRDFGPINLDRGFEQTRLRCAPEQRKETLTLTQPAILDQVANPVGALKPDQVLIDWAKDHDLIAQFSIYYKLGDRGCPSLHQLALPLWTRLGTPQFQGTEDSQGSHLALVWEDLCTRYTMRLPYDANQPVRFDVRDRQSPERLADREAAAHAFDRAERLARLQAAKSLARLPRQLGQFELGASRAQIAELLPTGQANLKQQFPGMFMVTFTAEPTRDDKCVLRQLFIRFGKSDRAAEIRARYVSGPEAGKSSWIAELVSGYKKRAGAPLELPSTWSSLWTDLSGKKSAARRYQWQDDVTQLTYQLDGDGAEFCLEDRLDEAAESLPPLEYLPRGTAGCVLGMKREDVFERLHITNPTTTPNGAVVLRPEGANPYDVVLLWFDKDQLFRIVARHSQQAAASGPAPAARALSEAWSRDVRTLGWPRRSDFSANDVPQSLAWHDDRIRVRTFWQENDDGTVRLFTEWKEIAQR